MSHASSTGPRATRASCRSRSRPACASSRRRPGLAVKRPQLERALTTALLRIDGAAHASRSDARRRSRAGGRRRSSGATARIILVSRETFTLRLFKHLKLVKTYRIAVGRAGPRDAGRARTTINDKQVNPSWHVPLSAWAGALAGQIIPPGPADPIKSRWLGFYNGAGIHGTADDLVDRHRRLARLHPDDDPRRRGSLRPRAAAHADLRRLRAAARRRRSAAPFRPSGRREPGSACRSARTPCVAAPLRVARSTGTGLTHVHVTATSPACTSIATGAGAGRRVACAPTPRWPWLSVP